MNISSLCSVLDTNLKFLEEKWGKDETAETPAARFIGLIRRAYEQTGRRVVVLVDEYDKPLLGVQDDLNVDNEICKVLRELLKTSFFPAVFFCIHFWDNGQNSGCCTV